jgi:hypothetical protein
MFEQIEAQWSRGTWYALLWDLYPSTRVLLEAFSSLWLVTRSTVTIRAKSPTMKKIIEGKIPELERRFSLTLQRPVTVKVQSITSQNLTLKATK